MPLEENVPLSISLRDFIYHQVTTETAQKMADLRMRYYVLAVRLYEMLPRCHERSLALTALEEALMRTIQCLAVSEGTPIPAGEPAIRRTDG